MQGKWNDLDRIIADSNQDINLDNNYNEILLEKIHNVKPAREHSERRIAAFSLIAAGFLLMATCSTTVQYKIVEYKLRLKGEVAALQYQHSDKFDFLKILIGE